MERMCWRRMSLFESKVAAGKEAESQSCSVQVLDLRAKLNFWDGLTE